MQGISLPLSRDHRHFHQRGESQDERGCASRWGLAGSSFRNFSSVRILQLLLVPWGKSHQAYMGKSALRLSGVKGQQAFVHHSCYCRHPHCYPGWVELPLLVLILDWSLNRSGQLLAMSQIRALRWTRIGHAASSRKSRPG